MENKTTFIKKNCSQCGKRIKGWCHPKYNKNTLLKEVNWCGLCWESIGKPKPEPINIAKLLKE